MTDQQIRLRRTRLLTASAVATAVVVTGTGLGIAHAAADPPALAFVATTTDITATLYDDGQFKYLDLDLGVNVIAGKNPFEIRATRKSYADPIVARQTVVKNGKKTTVTLPSGMVTGFGGFKDFTTVTIKNTKGATVSSYKTDFCPDNWSSARTRRDAPPSNPYPTSCGGDNPFLLGSVWGIQAGWNGPTDSVPGGSGRGNSSFTLPVGTYKATVALNTKYRDYFKIQAKQSTVTLGLKVVPYTDDPQPSPSGAAAAEGARARIEAARAASSASVQSLHEGHDAAQIGTYLPGFAPPAKAPRAAKAAPQTGPRPDLRSLPAWGISLEQGTDAKTGKPNGKWFVNFGATVWNAGTSPLLVDGFRRTGTQLMDAYQYFFDAKGNQVGSVAAGTMQWDARVGHKHWHFTDFAQYNLLAADKKLSVRSGKEAFCLANTDPVDYTVTNAKWRPENTDLSTSCGGNTAAAVREVLDIGNGDTYTQDRPGQSFEITGLKNGTYYIEVKANPVHKLSELNTANNSSLRKIVLGGTAAKRTLTVPPVNGIKG
jgi:hypothetical protein